jgi:hypothetical protein
MPLGYAVQADNEQTVRGESGAIRDHQARIEHVSDKISWLSWSSPAGQQEGPAVEALTPASPDSLPPLGVLIADEPFWRYPAGAAGAGVAHLRGRLTADPEPGHLAVVTETGTASGITESTERIWTALARSHGPSLVLLEQHPAPETGEGGETLDLVRVGADGSPHWTHAWPTPEENPRRAGLELWMAVCGYRIVSRPASAFDRCEDEGGHEPKVAWTSAASSTGT